MSPVLAMLIAVVVALWAAADSAGNTEVVPPVGWFFVLLVAMAFGAALGIAAS